MSKLSQTNVEVGIESLPIGMIFPVANTVVCGITILWNRHSVLPVQYVLNHLRGLSHIAT